MNLDNYKNIEEKRKTFPTYSVIDTVGDFDNWYNLHNKCTHYYRGQKEARYKNYTSVQRLLITHDLKCLPITLIGNQINILRKEYNHLCETYCILNNIICTDFFIMSIAQHYAKGVSPLLDVTSNLDTALYFMCREASFSIEGSKTKSLENYASIYVVAEDITNFEEIANSWVSDRLNLNVKSPQELYTSWKKAIQTLFHTTFFNTLIGKKPLLMRNTPYEMTFKNGKYKCNATLVFGNLNLTAQDGNFIYYENGREPCESFMECVDIHKSLIPYITQKYLIPNKKTTEFLFPNLNTIVNNSYEKLLANENILS